MAARGPPVTTTPSGRAREPVLLALDETEHASVRDLARSTGHLPQSVGRAVVWLRRKGWAERAEVAGWDPRRSWPWRLTAAGKAEAARRRALYERRCAERGEQPRAHPAWPARRGVEVGCDDRSCQTCYVQPERQSAR